MTKTAFVFPGQGSQAVGMLGPLAARFDVVTRTFAEASQVLGRDLWALVAFGPDDVLGETENTQPAMLAADVACYRVWQERGGRVPDLMAGHSLGEYAALVCAGALTFPDAVALVATRARLMQHAVPAGAGRMAAVLGLPDDTVRELCAKAAGDGVVEAVNFNAPGQVVIAGDRDAVERALALAKAAGAKRVLPLPVSVPSHCALMKEAAASFAEALARVPLLFPGIPVWHNVSAGPALGVDELRAALAAQLYSPVRWTETIEGLVHGEGVTRVVECGPGKVLAGLARRIAPGLAIDTLFELGAFDAALASDDGKGDA